ncbi:arabinan endo-1,5-alpha-L-arabinosidase, partial [Bacteroides thetaiotaomicron]|nr:arabinan endo-1,5-alpha-L-arabinosidase [Bacteroides thetaiotaomicron]
NKTYMLYHRHRWPFLNDGSAFRQTCLSELTFNDPENEINNIVPHHAQLFPDLNKDDRQFIKVDEILSSSERNKDFMAKNVLD